MILILGIARAVRLSIGEQMPTSSFLEMRNRNVLRIMSAVRTTDHLSRADVSRSTGLARATVSSIVDELLALGIIQETGSRESETGRRPIGLTFNPNARYVAGISVTYGSVEILLSDLAGNVRAIAKKDHANDCDIKTLIAGIVICLKSLLSENGIALQKLSTVGLAVPGPISESFPIYVSRPATKVTIDSYQLRTELEKVLKRPVCLDSNTNMAALAEIHAGAVQNVESAVVIRMGHQIRSALILAGKIFTGTSGLAGEIGHNQVPGKSGKCRCGKKGCINAVAGYDALIAACKSVSKSSVSGIARLIALAQNGQRECVILIREAAAAVGFGIAGIINVLAPERIIVCGQLLAAGDLFLEPMHDAIREYAIKANLDKCRVTDSKFDKNPEALGAALVAIASDELVLGEVVMSSLFIDGNYLRAGCPSTTVGELKQLAKSVIPAVRRRVARIAKLL